MKKVNFGTIEEGTCTCVYRPDGMYGLEGYELEGKYRYALVENVKTGKKHYRVWPSKDRPDYYETVGPRNFNKIFRRVVS